VDWRQAMLRALMPRAAASPGSCDRVEPSVLGKRPLTPYNTGVSRAAAVSVLLVLAAVVTARSQDITALRTTIEASEVRPVLAALRDELVPGDLRGGALDASWPRWVSTRNAAIRARVARGDEDSVLNLLFFGTSFTGQPRPSARDLGALLDDPPRALKTLAPRIDDFLSGVVAPRGNDRLQFAGQVLARNGIDIAAPGGRDQARRFLEVKMRAMAADAAAQSAVVDASGVNASNTFFERGLSSDTSIAVDYGIDHTLESLRARGVLLPATVRRVAIVGPGLDFSDKLQGYDFYPQQTIQPFAVVDSLRRFGLAAADGVRVTALDLSPRVLQHLESARVRARNGTGYPLVLPRNPERPWTAGFVAYWNRLGDQIGRRGPTPPVPANAGRVEVRGVIVRPAIVTATDGRDVNIVLERLTTPADGGFDLVIATNILVYYDVFEQTLAAINIARMLRPAGVFLTNTRIAEVPGNPLHSTGYTDTVYTATNGVDETGDRIVWYQR